MQLSPAIIHCIFSYIFELESHSCFHIYTSLHTLCCSLNLVLFSFLFPFSPFFLSFSESHQFHVTTAFSVFHFILTLFISSNVSQYDPVILFNGQTVSVYFFLYSIQTASTYSCLYLFLFHHTLFNVYVFPDVHFNFQITKQA